MTFSLIISHATVGAVNCEKETVILKTQSEIDSFQLDYGICDVLLGSLTIRESVNNNVEDLLGLAGLKTIKGSLIIESNDNLQSLEGLESLVTIGSNLTISFNSSLSDISSLSNLLKVSGTLLIDSNDELSSSEGIENLKQVDKLQIRNNDALNEIAVFSKLYGIGELDIYNNDSLSSLSAFLQLTNISDSMRIQGNSLMTDLTGLRGLSYIGNGLEISSNSSLPSLAGLEGILKVAGDLKILSNTQLRDCTSLVLLLGWPNVDNSVDGDVDIAQNTSGCNSISDLLATSPYDGPEKYTLHSTNCKVMEPIISNSLQSKETGLTNTSENANIDVICPLPRSPFNEIFDTKNILFDVSLKSKNLSTSANSLECSLTQVDAGIQGIPKPKTISLPTDTLTSIHWKRFLPTREVSGLVVNCKLPPQTAIISIELQASFASKISHSVTPPDITNQIFKNHSADCASYANSYQSSALDIGRNKYFSSSLTITANDEKCVIETNGIPNHDFNDSSSNFANEVNAVHRSFSISRNPEVLDSNIELSQNNWDAIMLNGVAVDLLSAGCYRPNAPNADSSGNVQAGCLLNEQNWLLDPLSENNNFETDSHNAHTQPDGTYHYHGNPLAMFEYASNEKESPVIGFAADGFPIFGSYFLDNGTPREALSSYRLKNEGGSRPGRDDSDPGGTYDGTYIQDYEYVEGSGDLDECNGMTLDGQYGYFVTDTYPWILRCFKNNIDDSFKK